MTTRITHTISKKYTICDIYACSISVSKEDGKDDRINMYIGGSASGFVNFYSEEHISALIAILQDSLDVIHTAKEKVQ